MKILLDVCMQPATIALNYSVKNIRNDVQRMIHTYIHIYYPVDISTTVFSYSRAVQYHAILHGTGVIAQALGLCGILATTLCFN